MRISRVNVRNLFIVYCKVFGFKHMTVDREIGSYYLEYYHGWLVCINLKGGGQSTPLGLSRRSNKEMWQCLHFAIDSLDERNRHGK